MALDNFFGDENIPDEISTAAGIIINNLLPKKSSSRYEKTYDDFMEWLEQKNKRYYLLILAKSLQQFNHRQCGQYIQCLNRL